MDKSTIKTHIAQFIVENFLYDDPEFNLTDDFPLFEERVIDSMGIFRLVTFMNEEFGVIVQPDDIVIDNFGTVADMVQLVDGHLKNGTSPQTDVAALA